MADLRDELLRIIGESFDECVKSGKDGDYINELMEASNRFMVNKVITPLMEEIYSAEN